MKLRLRSVAALAAIGLFVPPYALAQGLANSSKPIVSRQSKLRQVPGCNCWSSAGPNQGYIECDSRSRTPGVTPWDTAFTRLPEKHQALLNAYEGQDQRRRIRSLRTLARCQRICRRTRTASGCDLRREYLHLLTKDFTKLEADAYAAYIRAYRIVDAVVGLPLGDKGALAVPARLRGYLEQKGVLGPNEA